MLHFLLLLLSHAALGSGAVGLPVAVLAGWLWVLESR